MIRKIVQKFKQLLKGGFWHIFTGTFLNKAITMISSIVIARLVDKTQYAYLSYSDTIFGYVTLFSGLGLTSALLKVCAGDTDHNQDRSYLHYSIKCGLIFEIIVCSLVVSVCMLLTLPFEKAKGFIIIYSIYPVLYFVYDTVLTYLRAKQFNKFYAGINLLYSFITCIFSIGFVLIFDAVGIIYARYLTIIIIGVICIRKLFSFLEGSKKIDLDKKLKKSLWVMSLNIVIANAFSGMMPFNENLLIGNIIADEVVLANFRVAGLFPQMILLVAQAVNVYFFPIVAGLDNEGKQTKKYVIQVGILNFALVMGCTVIGMVFSPLLIILFYGEKYRDAIQISYYLWIMRGLNAGIRMVPMNMLLAIRKYKFNLVMSIVTFFLQIGLDWYFISTKGIVGVAYGTTGVYLVTGIIYWGYYLCVADK